MKKTPQQMFEEKQKSMKHRFSEKDVGMGVGNALTNATNLVICLINNAPHLAEDVEELEKYIEEWTGKIYRIGVKLKEFESIPVVENNIYEAIVEPKWAKNVPKFAIKKEIEGTKIQEAKTEEEINEELS